MSTLAGGQIVGRLTEADRERIAAIAEGVGAGDSAAALVDVANIAANLFARAESMKRQRAELEQFSAAAESFLTALAEMHPDTRELIIARARPSIWRRTGHYMEGEYLADLIERAELLKDCASAVTPPKRRGREPQRAARQVVAMLAEQWELVTDLRPTRSRGTAFYRFARIVLEAAGYVRREVLGTGSESIETLLRETLTPS